MNLIMPARPSRSRSAFNPALRISSGVRRMCLFLQELDGIHDSHSKCGAIPCGSPAQPVITTQQNIRFRYLCASDRHGVSGLETQCLQHACTGEYSVWATGKSDRRTALPPRDLQRRRRSDQGRGGQSINMQMNPPRHGDVDDRAKQQENACPCDDAADSRGAGLVCHATIVSHDIRTPQWAIVHDSVTAAQRLGHFSPRERLGEGGARRALKLLRSSHFHSALTPTLSRREREIRALPSVDAVGFPGRL
jgi:hypothetical protein